MQELAGSGWIRAIVAFGAIALAVVALSLILEALRQWRTQRAVSSRLRRVSGRGSGGSEGTSSGLVREAAEDELTWMEPLLLKLPRRLDLQHFLEQANVGWSVGAHLMLTLGMAVALGLGLLIAVGGWTVPVAGAVAGAMIPYFIVSSKRKKRFQEFEELFPEAIDLLARAIRAGHAFSTGLRVVAEETGGPVATEFRQVYEEQKFGLPLSDSLNALADRMSLVDVRIFVTAVLIQLESGGNLAEILDNLSYVVRERFRFRRQLKVHTAHGRMTAFALVGAPIAAGIGLFILNPDYMRVLLTEPLGRVMLAGAAAMQLLGYITIRRIIDIEV